MSRGGWMRSRVALPALALAILAPGGAGVASAAKAREDLRIGLITNAQGWGPDSGLELDRVPAGTRWLREDFEWRVIEPRDDHWDFSRYDRLFKGAAHRGIRILPLLGSAPGWLALHGTWNPMDHMPETADERSEFAEFTAVITARYGPGGTFWRSHPAIAGYAPRAFEIWNEPYLDAAVGGDADGGRYAELVREAAIAARGANPGVQIMIGADWAPEGDVLERTAFIDEMFAAVPSLGDFYDLVSVHPYTDGSPPADPDGGYGFPRIWRIGAELLAAGAPSRPFWITEIGWSTCSGAETGDTSCVSERTQADRLRQTLELLASPAYGFVEALFVYRRNDLGDPDDPKESGFGLQRLDGSRKPAWDVLDRAVQGPP